MKIMPCPLNGPRNISEFTFGGEVTPLPDVASAPDSEWAEHTFYSYNGTGVAREWWYHVPSGYWFVAERHRVTDDILRTYDPSELPADVLNSQQEAFQ
ncbi:MAG: sarcosine oxidase subunit delta [Oceanobacter sp.]|jgi:sarcosine oxidase subunit delta